MLENLHVDVLKLYIDVLKSHYFSKTLKLHIVLN